MEESLKDIFVNLAGDDRYWNDELNEFIIALAEEYVWSKDPVEVWEKIPAIITMWERGYKDRVIALCIDVSKRI
jgi:hypothetical protein